MNTVFMKKRANFVYKVYHMIEQQNNECSPRDITMRDVPCWLLEMINAKKAEILLKNPNHGRVSDKEAIEKLILKG